jgi:hypothetical protein
MRGLFIMTTKSKILLHFSGFVFGLSSACQSFGSQIMEKEAKITVSVSLFRFRQSHDRSPQS